MKIEVWSDFACPFCYIGKARFEKALDMFDHKDQVEIVYKAYQLNPGAPKQMEGTAAESFAKGHRMTVDQAKERFKMFIDNAKTVGLEYNYDIIQMTNTFDAHRINKWAQTKNKDFTARFMKAYFTEGLNLADHNTLMKLIQEFNLDEKEAKNILESNQFEQEVRQDIEEGRSIGVRGVPFFVLNRKYGISGAQQESYFLEALNTLWKEENPLEMKGSQGATCDDDTCTI